MTNAPNPAQVFIGSSAEGLKYARALQAELEASPGFMVQRWDIGTFDPGSLTLDALIEKASSVDFAILVATGEDTVTTRGAEMAAVRDNIIFEFGLFLGALGRKRVYLLSIGDAKLPSDLSGLTRLIFRQRPDGDIRAGLNDAVLRAETVMKKLGPRARGAGPTPRLETHSDLANVAKATLETIPSKEVAGQQAFSRAVPEAAGATRDISSASLSAAYGEQTRKVLGEEIEWLCSNARNQGWHVVKSNPTMLRLGSPKGREFTLTRRRAAGTRDDLRNFVAELRANGLRVNRALQGTVENSPFG